MDTVLKSSKGAGVFKLLEELGLDQDTLTASLIFDDEHYQEHENKKAVEIVTAFNEIQKINFTTSNGNTYEDYRNLIVLMAQDYRVIVLLLAERLVEMQNNKKIVFENKKEVGQITLNIFAPLAHRLGLGSIKTDLEELSLYYIDLEEYKKIVAKLESKKSERDLILTKIVDDIKPLIPNSISNYDISARNKSIYSIYNKIKNKEFEELYDLKGIRIICETVTECYVILGNIHEQFPPVKGRYKDYIAAKKANLYQSLHTAISIDGEHVAEIQIRTYAMDEIAEKGVAAHFLYKDQSSKNINDLEDQLHIFRDVIAKNDLHEGNKTDIFNSKIYAFTPTGKIIFLPNGATIIDFAFAIHSQVGDNMVGAKINDQMKPVNTVIQSGNQIEIIKRNNAKSCNDGWLEHTKTNHAKKKIKAILKQRLNDDSHHKIESGKALFIAMQKKTIIPQFEDTEAGLYKLMKSFGFSSRADFYIALYDKKINISEINEILTPKEIKIKIFNQPIKNQQLEDIIIVGAESVKKEIARCCYPIPGDQIIGVIHSGKSIRIHKQKCPNMNNNKKKIEASWNEITNDKYVTFMEIHSLENINLVSKYSNFFAKDNINIRNIKTEITNEQMVTKFELFVTGNEQLNKNINKIEKIKEVICVIKR